MKVCLLTTDEPLLPTLVEAIASAQCERVTEPTDADVVVALGRAEDAARLSALRSARGVDVLLLVKDELPRELSVIATDFALLPLRPGELAMRLVALRAKRGLRREDLLELAVEAADDVVLITNPDAVVQYVNRAFETTLGYPASEAIGSTPSKLFRSQLQREAHFVEVNATLASGKPWAGVILAKAKAGHLLHFEANIAPVKGADGRITHQVAVLRDITERMARDAELRAGNEALAQARDAALEASRIKSRFLANMSHELRTPLNAIIGYSEMIAEDAADSAQTGVLEDATKIGEASKRLLSLIDDVLDISKLEAGDVEMNVEELSLQGLVTETASTLQKLAYAKGNELAVSYAIDFDRVAVDGDKLRQILRNLLSNANKFTEQGPILVTVRAQDPPAGLRGEWFAIDVCDTGIGIAPEQLPRLFRAFSQGDGSSTRQYEGTGLGLAISQRLCTMMGGEITVESAVGQGSTFTIHLPRVAVASSSGQHRG